MKRKLIRGCVCFLLVILFIISAGCFMQDVSEYHSVKNKYSDIHDKAKKGRTLDWNRLHNINPNIVAWIEIPNTKIDYPVVQTRNNAEYLTKDIYGKYSRYGSIFLDERLYGTVWGTVPNNIVYGHNMGRWTDVMFGPLKEYLAGDYLKEHETVLIYTPEKTYRYKIASVEYGTSSSRVYETEFEDINFSEWVNEQTHNSLYQCLSEKKISGYVNKFTDKNLSKDIVKYGNTLTLSTCDTTHNNNKKICIFCIPEM